METVKDQPTLARAFVEAVRGLAGGRERLRLVLVGEGALRAEVQAVLEAGGCAELAWLPGAREDVADILRGLDVFALPSRSEGISNTVLEAMASALPVVATDVGGNPELVVEGETGRLVAPADPAAMAAAIVAYADDATVRARHGAAARARIEERFSLETMVNRYLAVYDDVLAAKGRRGAA